MKRVLFQPFEIGKWFALGFSAWLAGLLDYFGSGSAFGDSSIGEAGEEMERVFSGIGNWVEENFVIVIVAGGFLLLFLAVLFVVCLWVSSRGKFMFLDNVIHNRARVKIPWAEFEAVGNSLFRWRLGFSLAVFTALAFFAALLGGLAAYSSSALNESAYQLAIIGGSLLLLPVMLAIIYITVVLEDFVIPIMYRDSANTMTAWRTFLALHGTALGSFVVYFLWKILLLIAMTLCVFAIGLVTCCVGFVLMVIPYLGTVFLLPFPVFFRFLGLEFLCQFGNEYDILPTPTQLAKSPET